MCRSIKTLRGAQPTDDDVTAAALQFVRKVSGYRVPSRANAEAFEDAVRQIAATSQRLLEALPDTPASERKRPATDRPGRPQRSAT